MAKNDIVLLDGILDKRKAECRPSDDPGEIFEFLALEQVLKDFDLTDDELESGWVDGRGDGGIDGFFIFVNGRYLQDAETFHWPKSSAKIEIWLLTCKRHSTFEQATLDAILASIHELFDFSVPDRALRGEYSAELLSCRRLLHATYTKLATLRPDLIFHFRYVSRGELRDLGTSVAARATQINSVMESLFSSSISTFEFVGAAEIIDMFRRSKSFELELPFVDYLSGSNGYVMLVQLNDYYKFVGDSSHSLRRYLFDSNVRDYLGDTRVNEDIMHTLEKPTGLDFWWLNNGVTILVTKAGIVGKTIHLKDVQIVNGLQTTESIFRHLQKHGVDSSERKLLVRVIETEDLSARDQIIRATNNQTVVELSSLHATDKIQRDIEEILEQHGWYYERRKNYFRNIGKPKIQMVSPMYVAVGVVALFLKNPALAAGLKSRFMNNTDSYQTVFSASIPLPLWPVIVQIMKSVDRELDALRPKGILRGEKFLSNWRPLIALVAVAKSCGTFNFGAKNLSEFDVKKIDSALVGELWREIGTITQPGSKWPVRNRKYALDCCKAVALKFNVSELEVVCRRNLISVPEGQEVSEQFLIEVDGLLPAQPWKPGAHQEVARKLNCKGSKVTAAIQELITRGLRFQQIDGIVYDEDGKVICFDKERLAKESQDIADMGAILSTTEKPFELI